MVIGDDDVEAARLRARDLVDGRDPAVDGQHEAAALVGEPVERLAGEAVALVEAARQVPVGVGAERAQRQDGECRRADPVDVVVAVDADALARGDRRANRLDGRAHVAEQEGVVLRRLRGEEGGGGFGVGVAAANEYACGQLADLEGARERLNVVRRHRL